ncbi:hypothetical protein PtA15_10A321 [Puccinia triticina]|uniref:CCHC-type domain-containing protein n=1 Tax=Puccinia triticina TaxID=208348 RepID=A0ABY7CW80_9BASI|nr:uncharacterized protein PtA15_10A321 [Puccinia triticina]WAQ88899.1 hypothetical protein PtA15_10A321 [Puccinia triticina]
MSQINTIDVSPRNKFLQQPSVYKSEIEQLTADGSNFNKWKRDLLRVILLTLSHAAFFENPDNYKKISAQEETCLLYLIQITVHDELSLLVDRITGPATDPSQVQGLFNKLFDVFADLKNVQAALPPFVESLILQAAIITSAYGESNWFDTNQPQTVSVFRSFQPNWQGPRYNQQPHQNTPGRSNNHPPQHGNQPNHQQSTVGKPGNPTVNDILAALNNIKKGNQGPSDPSVFSGKPCAYCGVQGHLRLSCPTLRGDAKLPPPNTPLHGRPISGFARQAAPPNNPPTGQDQNAAVRSAVGADATGAAGDGTVLDSGATHHWTPHNGQWGWYPHDPEIVVHPGDERHSS